MEHRRTLKSPRPMKISAPIEKLGTHPKVRRISSVLVKKLGAHPKVRRISSALVKKLGVYQNIRRISSAPAYYLGSAESPTADFLPVWLKSSRSSGVASRSCRPQVPCPCPVMAFIQTSDQSGAGIAAAAGLARAGGGQVRGGWRGEPNQATSAPYQRGGVGRPWQGACCCTFPSISR
jgi:hypothetical protein